MRLIPYLAVCAGLASAAPLNIIVTTTSEAATYRLGKPVHDVKSAGAMRMGIPPTRMRQACNKMQGGVTKLFALAGLGPAVPPDLEAFAKLAPEHHAVHMNDIVKAQALHEYAENQHHHDGHHRIDVFGDPIEDGGNRISERPHRVHHFHHNGHFRHMLHRGSFMRRIHRALMSLGPWEGRAVAFVLGCGIGVILRMFWILVVVAKRAVRGESEPDVEEVEYGHVGVVHPTEDGEELFLAPPEYFADEKTPLPEDAKK